MAVLETPSSRKRRPREEPGKRHDPPPASGGPRRLRRGSRSRRRALFQSVEPAARRLMGQALEQQVALAMFRRRPAAAGRPPSTCCHTFRATVGLAENALTETVPDSAGKLVDLRVLFLCHNEVDGIVAGGVGTPDLSRAADLQSTLSRNRLTGAIPTSLGNLVRRRVLAVHRRPEQPSLGGGTWAAWSACGISTGGSSSAAPSSATVTGSLPSSRACRVRKRRARRWDGR